MIRRYILNNLIALDQWGNVLLGGNNPDETISSAVGADYRRRRCLTEADGLSGMTNTLQRGHE